MSLAIYRWFAFISLMEIRITESCKAGKNFICSVYSILCEISSLEFGVCCTQHSMCTITTPPSCLRSLCKSFQLFSIAQYDGMLRHVSPPTVLFLLAIFVVVCFWSASLAEIIHTHSTVHSMCLWESVQEGGLHVWNTISDRNIWAFWLCGDVWLISLS